MSKQYKWARIVAPLLVMVLAGAFLGSGCSTGRQSGALAGAGVGALIGQAVGRNTSSTVIGAAIGVGAGYIIGNEMDQKKAKERAAKGQAPEVGPLGGTRWKAVSIVPAPQPPYKTYTLAFGKDGWVDSVEEYADGARKVQREHYRVVGQTLIINSPGYLINAKYSISGKQLVVDAPEFRAVFARI